MVLIMMFWFWFFKKIGLYKSTRVYDYQWTQKDRTRLDNVYLKKTGRTDMVVSYEFDDEGFTIIPEQSPPKKYLWSEIIRVIERPKGLFIYIRTWMYFWAPKAAFTSPEDYRASLDIISAKVRRCEKLNLAAMAYVALGSNLGNREESVQNAISGLRELSGQPFLKSSLWQTSPVDCSPGSPGFINAVVALTPVAGETPESLLIKLQRIEKKSGRAPKKVLNEPRPLDLDLIAFGSETRSTPEFTLPHLRAHQRKFVLEPLNEIAPDLILAGQGKNVSQLLAGLSSDETVVRIKYPSA